MPDTVSFELTVAAGSNSKGKVETVQHRGICIKDVAVVKESVPQLTFGYFNLLRGYTQGKASRINFTQDKASRSDL